jgi:hypothetical protein
MREVQPRGAGEVLSEYRGDEEREYWYQRAADTSPALIEHLLFIGSHRRRFQF